MRTRSIRTAVSVSRDALVSRTGAAVRGTDSRLSANQHAGLASQPPAVASASCSRPSTRSSLDSSYVLGRLSPVTFPWCARATISGFRTRRSAYGLELVEPLLDAVAKQRTRVLVGRQALVCNQLGYARQASGDWSAIQSPIAAAARRCDTVRCCFTLAQRRTVRQRLGSAMAHSCSRCRISGAARASTSGSRRLHQLLTSTRTCGTSLRRERSGARVTRRAGSSSRRGRSRAVRRRDRRRDEGCAVCRVRVLHSAKSRGGNDVEGFGIVFLEAGSYGKAVIGGNNGGVPEAVADGMTGLLVDTGSGQRR